MSWSVSAVGYTPEVTKTIDAQMGNLQLTLEPEKAIKDDVHKLITTHLQALPVNKVVSVSAWGSQSVDGDAKVTGLSLGVTIT
jgi:hypothetical protein